MIDYRETLNSLHHKRPEKSRHRVEVLHGYPSILISRLIKTTDRAPRGLNDAQGVCHLKKVSLGLPLSSSGARRKLEIIGT